MRTTSRVAALVVMTFSALAFAQAAPAAPPPPPPAEGVSLMPSAEFSVRLAESDRRLEALEARQSSAHALKVVGAAALVTTGVSTLAGSVAGGLLFLSQGIGFGPHSDPDFTPAVALFITAAATLVIGVACFIAAAVVSPSEAEKAAVRAERKPYLAAEEYAMPPLPVARVTLTDASGGQHLVEAEVAATDDSRTRGLMWRPRLADGHGMLFIFAEQQFRSFGMRTTLIALDMLFVDQDLRIAGIVDEAGPKTQSIRGPGKPSRYVLAVPGGWAARNGVQAGSLVNFDGLEDIAVIP